MSSKIVGILHIIAQVLAQGAIIALFPVEMQQYLQGVVVIIGIVIAYIDPTNTIEKLGMSKQQYLGSIQK